MKSNRLIVFLGALFALSLMSNTGIAETPITPRVAMIQSTHAFAEKVDVLLSKKGDASQNKFYSSFNIQNAFQLIYPGSTNAARTDLSKAFGFSTSWENEDFNEAFGQVRADLISSIKVHPMNAKKVTKLKLGTQLWANSGNGFEFNPEFELNAMKFFNAITESFDFGAKEVTRRSTRANFTTNAGTEVSELASGSPLEVINSAVAYDTDLMIQNLLSEVKASTPAILISTLLIDATWAEQFLEWKTRAADAESEERRGYFYDVDGNAKAHNIMTQTEYLGYAEGSNFKAVRKGTWDGKIAVEFYLSNSAARDDVEKFRNSFLGTKEVDFEADFNTRYVDFWLPRFKAKYKQDITSEMTEMMPGAFSSGGFGNLGNAPTQIGQVIHETALEVHEKGFRAAAATALVLERTSADPPVHPVPVPVHINRAFGIRIVDTASNIELFKGWIASPENMDAPAD